MTTAIRRTPVLAIILASYLMIVLDITIFTLASLLVGLAQTAGWLVAARGLQGVGARSPRPSPDSEMPLGTLQRRPEAY